MSTVSKRTRRISSSSSIPVAVNGNVVGNEAELEIPFYETIKNINYKFLCVSTVIFFVSGSLFNHMRATGFALQNTEGGMLFIAPSYREQLLSESYIVMALYSLIVFSIIQLIQIKETKPVPGKPYSQVLDEKIVLYGGCFILGFIGLTYVAKMKS